MLMEGCSERDFAIIPMVGMTRSLGGSVMFPWWE